MENLIETFHLDFKLLLAQAINFLIIFLVLYYFAFKPLARVMKERTKKIEKSLADAKKIEEKLALTEKNYRQKMIQAKKEATGILEKASLGVEEKKQAMIIRAKEEIGQIINQEKNKLVIEKAKTLKEIKREVADLVILSLEKILEKKLDQREDQELIKKIIKNTK